ncbi:DedA family protein [Candidatus Gracilibacteria bacterium 28_42_T64]|nr:DedA family protein [Candidatus Gracilibacteria bacterium 28_42_T64]
MLKNIFKKIIHILNIILIGLSFSLALIALFKKEWIEQFIEWMKVLIDGLGMWNYLIAGLSSLIESFPVLGIVVPGQNILLIVGGFFGNISTTNLIYVVIIASIGAIIGNYIGYLLGKYFGDSFFKKYGLWFGIGLTEVKYLKKGIDKWGPLGIILGKFHPMTRSFLPFIAGSMGMHSAKFMLYNIIGSIIRATVIIVLGVIFVAYYKIILEHLGTVMIGVMALVGFYIYKFKRVEFKKYMDEKNKEFEEISKKK